MPVNLRNTPLRNAASAGTMRPMTTYIARPDKWLFICGANIARSPTAEYLARKMGLLARSCGTDKEFRVTPMTREIVQWADVIVCMKERHRAALYSGEPLGVDLQRQKLFVWGLDDDWGRPYDSEMMLKTIERKLLASVQEYEQWREKNRSSVIG